MLMTILVLLLEICQRNISWHRFVETNPQGQLVSQDYGKPQLVGDPVNR